MPFGPPTDVDNYADSEEIAYHVGEKPLKNFLDYLQSKYPGKENVFSHSMGAVVTSAALRYGGQVATYAACQAAMVGHAYDPLFENRTPVAINWETPEVYASYPPSGLPYFGSITQKIFNFYNCDDKALDSWEYGQNLKPNESEGYECHGFSATSNEGNFLYIAYPPLTFSSDTYEIYAHCAEGRSYPLGARMIREIAGAKGNFDLQNFSDAAANFGDDHSGQWNGTLMIRYRFWRVLLLDAFELNISKATE